jgi:hypothetical protein
MLRAQDGFKHQVTASFEGWIAEAAGAGDREKQEELKALRNSLLAELPTLEHLVHRHKVPLPELLLLLRNQRLDWRFVNSFRLFEGRDAKDIERLPAICRQSAEALHDAAGVLVQRWRYHLLCRDKATTEGTAVDPEWNETYELVAAAAVLTGSPDAPFLDLEECEARLLGEIRIAVAVLRRAGATIERLPLREGRYQQGSRILGRGPRRMEYEAYAARQLIEFLQRETSLRLYDYVGPLLRATFPTLKGWRDTEGTRMRDRVKQLIGARTPPNRGDVIRSKRPNKRR